MTLTTRRYTFPSITATEAFLAAVPQPLETHAIFAPDPAGTSRLTIVLRPEQLEVIPALLPVHNGTVLADEVAPKAARKEEPVAKEPKAKAAPKAKAEPKSAGVTPDPAAKAPDATAQSTPTTEDGKCRFCRLAYKDVGKHEAKRHADALAAAK